MDESKRKKDTVFINFFHQKLVPIKVAERSSIIRNEDTGHETIISFINVVKTERDCKGICQNVLSYSRMNSIFK